MRRPRVPLYLQIVAGMALGLVVGPLLGARAAPLGELGKLVIQLIKAAATPLLFFAVVNAILKTEVRGRAGLRMLGLAAVNATVALAIGLLLSNVLEPGRSLTALSLGGAPSDSASPAAPAAATGGPSAPASASASRTNPVLPATVTDKKIDLLKTFSGYIPTNIVQPFADNLIISVVLLALLFGLALRALGKHLPARGEEEGPDPAGPTSADTLADGARTIAAVVAALLRMTEIVLGWVIRLIPLAVFGVVARTVGEQGFAPLKGLATYLGVGLLGLVLHVVVTYHLWIALGSRIGVRRFWRQAKEPLIYALGANSSLATLPLTLRALGRLGVSRGSSALGACVGTTFNNDGIILYEGMAVLFVAQAHGLHLDAAQQLLAAGFCLVAAMGVAGVPEAGMISLALVLNTVGLPLEVLPLLLTVDWILGRARSATNVLSDMVLSILIDRRAPAPGAPPAGGPWPPA